jgi:hypothetical protein
MMYSRLDPLLVILSRVEVARPLATDEPPVNSVALPLALPQPLLGVAPSAAPPALALLPPVAVLPPAVVRPPVGIAELPPLVAAFVPPVATAVVPPATIAVPPPVGVVDDLPPVGAELPIGAVPPVEAAPPV